MQRRSNAGENRRMRAGQSRAETENRNKISAARTKVASKHDIEVITAVALACVMSKGANVFPVMGGRKVEHLKDTIQAMSIKLTHEQIAFRDTIKAFDPDFPRNLIPVNPRITGRPFLISRTNAKQSSQATSLRPCNPALWGAIEESLMTMVIWAGFKVETRMVMQGICRYKRPGKGR